MNLTLRIYSIYKIFFTNLNIVNVDLKFFYFISNANLNLYGR